MKIITIVAASVTVLLLLSQLMCGLWIRSKGADEKGKRFHSQLGIANVVFGIITAVLAIILAA